MAVENAADLYGLPVDEFTAARNELADRLKAAGDADEAKQVRALKKPSMVAWTVNQLARNHPEDLEEFFRLRDEIEGASSAGELRTHTERRRKLLTKMVSRARNTLTDAGHSAAAATIEKVSQTLLAADDDTRDSVLQGTLERELTSTTSTFGAFGSFDAATVTFDEPDAPDPHIERLQMEADDAEEEARQLEVAAAEAERISAQARDRAAEAQRKAIKARERATKAAKA